MERTSFLQSEEATINFGQSGTVERFCGRVSASLWGSKSASFRALLLACCSESKSRLKTSKVILFLHGYPKSTASWLFLSLTSLSVVVNLQPDLSLQPRVCPRPCLLAYLPHKSCGRKCQMGETGGAGGWWVVGGGGRCWLTLDARRVDPGHCPNETPPETNSWASALPNSCPDGRGPKATRNPSHERGFNTSPNFLYTTGNTRASVLEMSLCTECSSMFETPHEIL